MKEINLTQGKVALVDDEDFEYLNQWKWYAQKGHSTWYAVRNTPYINKKRSAVKMHRIIIGIRDVKVFVDHINHNGLDNQKHNLRTCTNHQNILNTSSRKNSTSKYTGVSWNKRLCNGKFYPTWLAQISFNKKVKHIGYFKNEHVAALAYNIEAKKLFGEFANLNHVETDFIIPPLLGQVAPVSLMRHLLQFHPLL